MQGEEQAARVLDRAVCDRDMQGDRDRPPPIVGGALPAHKVRGRQSENDVTVAM